MVRYDYLIVGAGLAGTVLAERIANRLGKRVLLLERRSHIGGNCFDEVDSESGVLIHRYGPHLFHTDSERVMRYLGQFAEWRNYTHKVVAQVDGRLLALPFSFYTLYQCYPFRRAARLQRLLIRTYGKNRKVPILELIQSEEPLLRELGTFIYQKIFLNYTSKQWGKRPEEIDPSVTARVPLVTAFDTRYFSDRFQAVPAAGYTRLFEAMLDSEYITLRLGVDAASLLRIENEQIYFHEAPFTGTLIYTGAIDALFDYRYGELAYRSLDLRFERIGREYYQTHSVVNYPNEHAYTRITEFKHIHPVSSSRTTILKEYPQPYRRGENQPFYPLLTEENRTLYLRYKKLADRIPNLMTVGRLAEFRYYDMDDIVLRALTLFEKEICHEK